MQRLLGLFFNKDTWLQNWVTLLAGLWIFAIPLGRGAQIPVAILAVVGLAHLILTKGACVRSRAVKSFLILVALYVIPVAISMIDAPAMKYPVRVFFIGLGSGLAGIALISACVKEKVLDRIGMIFAIVVGFWFLYAAGQAVFGADLFRENWQGADGRISGPFRNVNLMGYYAGPYSALVLMYALRKQWKPILLWILFFFLSIIIVINNSRGGWIMYMIVAAAFIWKSLIAPRKHKLALSVGVVVAGLALMTGLYCFSGAVHERIDQTLMVFKGDKVALNEALTDRLPVWEAACSVIKTHPINGCGARNFRCVALEHWPVEEFGQPGKIGNTFHPHQLLLEYGLGTGIIGLIGLALSMGLCIRWWIAASSKQKSLAAGVGLTLLATYCPINTHRAMFASLEALSIWFLIALYCAAVFFEEEA